MSETETDPRAAEAEAYLRANGVEGITITGNGDDWFVSVGFAAHERFVTAYSGRNPLTPNDPVYLAEQALVTLIRNERPHLLEPEPAVALDDEASETPVHESNGETGEDAPQQADVDARGNGENVSFSPKLDAERVGGTVASELDGEPEIDGGQSDGVLEPSGTFEPEQPIDAEFEEPADLGAELLDVESELAGSGELEGPPPEDFAPDEITRDEAAPGVAIFGPPADHLEALRSQRMGDTMRYANMLMPPWTPTDNARLAYLRNFAMGVSEGRWPNDSAMQAELESYEATLGRVNDLKEARDQKVAFLEGADRAGVEGFVVERDWP